MQQVNVQTKSDKMVSDSYTLSDGMESSVSLDKIPTIKLQGNSGETSNESHSMGTIIRENLFGNSFESLANIRFLA